jgi:hypothetical protein
MKRDPLAISEPALSHQLGHIIDPDCGSPATSAPGHAATTASHIRDTEGAMGAAGTYWS